MKKILFCLALLPVASLSVHAATYTYTPAGTTTNWSDVTNWSNGTTTGAGYPSTTSDTANLTLTTGSQTVVYDTNASGTLGTLNMTNTGTGTNVIDQQRTAFAVSTAVTLGSTTGTNDLILDVRAVASSGSGAVFTSTNGLALNTGGMLEMRPFVSTANTSGVNVSAPVTISGGTLAVEEAQQASGGGVTSVSSNVSSLTMSAGTLAFGGSYTPIGTNTFITENRLATGGVVNVTGGTFTVATGTTASLFMQNASNTLNNVTGANLVALYVNLASDASLSSNSLLGAVFSRLTADSKTLTLTNTNTATTGNLGTLVYIAPPIGSTGAVGTTETVKLGSDLKTTLVNSTNPIQFSNTNFGSNTGSATFVLDLNGHAYDLTNTTVTFRPTNPFVSSNQLANFSVQATTGAGTLRAVSFDFTQVGNGGTSGGVGPSTTTATAGSTIGAGVTLQSTGGNAAVNNLSAASSTVSGTLVTSTGTISPTSIFLYSGTAARGSVSGGSFANEATLVSTNRNIGMLQVTTGALNINQSALTTGGAVAVSGAGTLDINGTGYGALTLAAGNFSANTNAILELTLGANLDTINATLAGQSFSLNGVTIAINGSASQPTYQVFTGFTGTNTVTGVTFTGVPAGETASIDTTGLITFSATAVPEPAETVQLLIAGSVLGTGLLVGRRRRKAMRMAA